MKKNKKNLLRTATIIVLLVLFISCSSDDSNSKSSSSINPPSWIIGTWQNDDLGGLTYGFKFAKDDICLMNLNMTTCFKEILKLDAGSGVYDINEEITDNSYFIEIKVGITTYSYEFTKISTTEIETYDALGGSITLTKQ